MTFIADVRNFQHRFLHYLVRDGQVPLVTIRRAEVRRDGIEGCIGAYTSDCVYQSRVDGVEAAEGRVVAQLRGSVAAPVRVDRRRPRRVAVHAQNVFDNVGAAHEAPESSTDHCLAFAGDIPSHTHAWLKAFVVRKNQRSGETSGAGLIGSDQTT